MFKAIKFRGVDRKSGEMVYGDLIQPCVETEFYPTIKAGFGEYHEVEPESIAQYVGVDHSGKEVYENDKLINYKGEEFTALLTDNVLTAKGFIHYIPTELLFLKE